MKKENGQKNITEDVVRYVANLSRLRFEEAEVGMFRGQLSAILDYVNLLDEVDTKNTQPTTHVLPSMKNVFREDEPAKSLPPEEALKNAPAKNGNFFVVPKIIKNY
ncbi:MAG: Asp-tRNA(Asn)/Glu-tRNA(Gln) amidotransferase subunit GatC [Candidatus Omnitrophota bacterium]